MRGLNKVQLMGNLTQDPEVKQTPNGKTVVNFSLATNENYTDSTGNKVEKAEFHSIVLWEKQAELAASYLKKGSPVFLEGKLQTRSWEAQDGSKRYKTEIIGSSFILTNSKGDKTAVNEDGSVTDVKTAPTVQKSTSTATTAPKAAPKVPQEEDISIEDIPF